MHARKIKGFDKLSPNGRCLFSVSLGVSFHRTGDVVALETGVHVAASREAGVELVHPMSGSAKPIAQCMERYLQSHGDGGVFAVGYCTDDIDAALQAAERSGISKLLPKLKFSQEHLGHESHDGFSCFEGDVFDTDARMGYLFAYNLIESAHGVVSKKHQAGQAGTGNRTVMIW